MFKTLLLGATAGIGLAALQPARAAAKDPIVFVAAIIQSGPFKVTDAQNLAGVQFAVQQINKAGGVNGHPIKLDIIADAPLSRQRKKMANRRRNLRLVNHNFGNVGVSGCNVHKCALGCLTLFFDRKVRHEFFHGLNLI